MNDDSFDDELPEAPLPPPRPPSIFALKPLDALERKVTLGMAALAAAVSVGSWVPEFEQSAAIGFAAIGLLMAGALAWSAMGGSRFLAGTAAFLISFAPWRFVFAGMPFLVLGLWLWFRGRPTPEEVAERRRLREEAIAARRAAKRGAPAKPSTGKTPPKPSKRYTPPAGKR